MTKWMSINFLPVLPLWSIALIALGLLGLLAAGCAMLRFRNVPKRWITLLGALRIAVVVVFVLCLLQPVVSYSRTVKQLPELLVLVDSSESMGTPSASGQGSRLDEVRKALLERKLASSLRDQFRIHWFGFDKQAYSLSDAGELGGLKPAGESTRFAESLKSACDARQVTGAARAPARALLVSDGDDLGTEDVVETAKRLGIAIHTLAPAAAPPDTTPQDVKIADVQCARRVLHGSETRFLVTLRGTAGASRPLVLTLLEDGKEVVVQEAALGTGKSETQLVVSHRPLEAGLKRYEFRLTSKDDPTPAAASPEPAEAKAAAETAADATKAETKPEAPALPKGKRYAVSVQVLGDKHEVLILEDTWRWTFKFLRRILEDDPTFSLTAFVTRNQNAFVQFGEPDRKVNLGRFPQGRAELDWFDTIILGDVNPARWPKGLSAAIAKSVKDDGKSLVVVAGPNIGAFAEIPELALLLPVEISGATAVPVEGPVDVRLSVEGARSPFFFHSPLGGEESVLNSLPALDQIYPPIRKRPAATVLLEASKQANASGNVIVMAEHTIGNGRVLFIGTDTLWKWQTLGPQSDSQVTLFQLFWQQALRALAPTRPKAELVNLWLQPDHSRYESGARVLLEARVDSERPLESLKLQSTVILPNGRQLPLALTADPVSPQTYRAEFEATLVGQYRITASASSAGKPLAETSTPIEVERRPGESTLAAVDTANMARIAAATGGQVVDLADAKTWPTSADFPPLLVSERKTVDLWNNFSLLLVLCTLLGADWLLRLLRGYV